MPVAEPARRVPWDEHRADVAALLAPLLDHELRPLGPELLGRIAASDRRAAADVPSADVSQMDGFAVRSSDLGGGSGNGGAPTSTVPAASTAPTTPTAPAAPTGPAASTSPAASTAPTTLTAPTTPAALPVGAMIAAGDAPSELPPGTVRPIMTGAPVPAGADLVVPIEEATAGGFTSSHVRLSPADATPGRFVRARASDTRIGDRVLSAGDVLTAARIAHLASVGVRDVDVQVPVPTVVLSTGSELETPGAPITPGRAHDANGPGLAAALRDAGAEIIGRGSVPDDPSALLDLLTVHARSGARLLVTSGGVSAGAFEVVKQAADLPGVELTFVSVAMQPGGPQGIGTVTVDGTRLAWVAFPGNPVSALLSCELFLRPALRAAARPRLRLPVRLERPESSPPHLQQFRRAHVLPSGVLRLAGGPSSHLLGALAGADALAVVPVGIGEVHDGDVLEAILLPT